MDCLQIGTCIFFREYRKYDERKLALVGLAKLYCKGPMQRDCIRRKLGMVLGDQNKVPVNMMPDGQPLADTDTSDWPEEVMIKMRQSS